MTHVIHHGDCLDVLREMPDNSIDSIATDPPYGLSNTSPDKVADAIVRWASGDREYMPAGRGFMGSAWDAFVPPPAVWDECFRVLKPGGHLVAFAGDRTQDLMGISIRLSGMEIRSNLAYLYGSGFPKSHDVGKSTGDPRFSGVGTALKPAHEPIILARKPFKGTVAANTLEWGTGGINIDATRIESEANRPFPAARGGTFILHGCQSIEELEALASAGSKTPDGRDARTTLERYRASRAEAVATSTGEAPAGRWPANVVLDPDTAQVLDQQSGNSKSASGGRSGTNPNPMSWTEQNPERPRGGHDDEGGASRFFKVVEPDPPFMYAAKAPKKERPSYTDAEGKTIQHSTVKPLSICRWLVKLCTPPGGTVLDPFAGSGTTIEAALLEGFNVIGIEREDAYLPLIQQRIDRAAERLPAA